MLLPSWETRQAKLIERNLQNAFVAMADICKIQGQSQYVFSRIPHPVFNCVIKANASDSEVEDIMENIMEDYQKGNSPHSWWISKRSEPKNFGRRLEEKGLQVGPSYVGMHVCLREIDVKLQKLSNVRVERVSNIKDFDLWIKPIQESFAFSDEVTNAFLQKFKELFVEDNRFINYLAFFDNHFAGSATMFLDEGSVGLYNGAVFSTFRNQGVMSCLGNVMMQEAKNLKYDDMVVQVNDISQKISAKAGFKEYLNFQAYIRSDNI